jgi:hypothetical protein
MVVVFVTTWLPLNIYNLLLDFAPSVSEWYKTAIKGRDITYTVSLVVFAVAMMNNVAGPILYAFLNPQFATIIRNRFNKFTCAARMRKMTTRKNEFNHTQAEYRVSS